MLQDYLKPLANAMMRCLGYGLLLIAILICLFSSGCSTQRIVVPNKQVQAPQSLTKASSPDAEAYCSEVQSWLNEAVKSMDDAQQTKTH